MKYFVHAQALCESSHIGDETRVWAFAHILPGARLGQDCNICDHVFIENDVVLGDRVTVKCGVQLWDGLRIGSDVFIGPNATFSNDHFPRSKQRPTRFLETVIGEGASIGANATILPGINVGRGAMVGAGAVVTRSVPPNAIVVGNPARVIGYAGSSEAARDASTDALVAHHAVLPLSVGGASVHELKTVRDHRGQLNAAEFEHDVPFPAKRFFVISGVPSAEIRGEHAHRECEQFLVCVQGSCKLALDDGHSRCELVLDDASKGVYLPKMVWGSLYRYSADAVLLVFASDHYDDGDYIRNYDDFVRMATGNSR